VSGPHITTLVLWPSRQAPQNFGSKPDPPWHIGSCAANMVQLGPGDGGLSQLPPPLSPRERENCHQAVRRSTPRIPAADDARSNTCSSRCARHRSTTPRSDRRPAARQSPACSRAHSASARSRRRHGQPAQSDYAASAQATARTAHGAFAPSAGLRAGSGTARIVLRRLGGYRFAGLLSLSPSPSCPSCADVR
jgi:hypothetical protein